MNRSTWNTAALAIVLVATGCAGQTGGPAGESQEKDGKVARSEIERGPVRVTVTVEPAKARLSDEPTLTLSIDSQQGVKVRKPPFGESLGDFLVRDFREPMPRVQGDREIVQQVYKLEPTRTGKLSIWPISVTFTDDRPGGDGKEHTIETEGLTVQVESVLGTELPSLGALKPAAGPVELPQSGRAGVWWLILLLAAIGVVPLVWWLRRRRRKAVAEKTLSPREQAYLELERLLADGLAERDVKLFYVELTGVVRRYIERTTGIRAPEETTEEFLREISRRHTFRPEESRRLRDFLESADLVKFAAYQPRREDVEESFQRAKVFIGLERVEVAA